MLATLVSRLALVHGRQTALETVCGVASKSPGPILLLASGIVFFRLAMASGYGYDALEYLVIGRSVVDGYPFFHFVPSKSFGLYVLVSALMRAGLGFDHETLPIIVTLIYSLVVATTFTVSKAMFGTLTAMVASLLVGAASAFMELNYLEPEGFVFIAGAVALLLLVRGLKSGKWHYFLLSGFCIAFGTYFKSVASLYLLATAAGIVAYCSSEARGTRLCGGWISTTLVGFALASAMPVAYFWATSRVEDYWKWTVYFPLFQYPSNTYYLNKLWTKLLWFWLLVLSALVLSLRSSLRHRVWADQRVTLVFCFGVLPLLSLVKTQASHYYFPGAAFLCIFAAVVAGRLTIVRVPHPARRAGLVGAVCFVAALIGSGVLLYRPTLIGRLILPPSVDNEKDIAHFVDNHIPVGAYGLFFRSSTLLYWVGNRYPNAPFLNTDVQTTRLLLDHPDALLVTLRDPDLLMVEFDPDAPAVDDPYLLASRRDILGHFTCGLQRAFRRLPDSPPPYVFWARRAQFEPPGIEQPNKPVDPSRPPKRDSFSCADMQLLNRSDLSVDGPAGIPLAQRDIGPFRVFATVSKK